MNFKTYQLESFSALGFVKTFSPESPLHGTYLTESLNPACFKKALSLLTISLNLSFDQSTVSNLFITTANCETPKKLNNQRLTLFFYK